MKEDEPILDNDKVIEVKIKEITLGQIKTLVWGALKGWHFIIGKGTLCLVIINLIVDILKGKK